MQSCCRPAVVTWLFTNFKIKLQLVTHKLIVFGFQIEVFNLGNLFTLGRTNLIHFPFEETILNCKQYSLFSFHSSLNLNLFKVDSCLYIFFHIPLKKKPCWPLSSMIFWHVIVTTLSMAEPCSSVPVVHQEAETDGWWWNRWTSGCNIYTWDISKCRPKSLKQPTSPQILFLKH